MYFIVVPQFQSLTVKSRFVRVPTSILQTKNWTYDFLTFLLTTN
ncbi:hypothetical protein LEP1GSC081_3148 [Leptospira kirschneri str. H1]|uniref:Uncharacterized protein n=1 Tax=Leptospira kirschneri str. H1 TaxID=1049966 RepID=A0A0E2AY08_9LEPT|nr:hypothetical protein LEP1GSC081_3148 [Leptospira kirschneri str. H1]